jgi:hypothetical protein
MNQRPADIACLWSHKLQYGCYGIKMKIGLAKDISLHTTHLALKILF